MGYYISNMIGIRLGGVFSDETDMDDLKGRIANIVKEMDAEGDRPNIADDPSHCLSRELVACKGSYAVIAGVFNYWGFASVSEFAKRLSKACGTEVMLMSWNEQTNEVQCKMFLDGRGLYEVNENPIGRILRRVGN